MLHEHATLTQPTLMRNTKRKLMDFQPFLSWYSASKTFPHTHTQVQMKIENLSRHWNDEAICFLTHKARQMCWQVVLDQTFNETFCRMTKFRMWHARHTVVCSVWWIGAKSLMTDYNISIDLSSFDGRTNWNTNTPWIIHRKKRKCCMHGTKKIKKKMTKTKKNTPERMKCSEASNI